MSIFKFSEETLFQYKRAILLIQLCFPVIFMLATFFDPLTRFELLRNRIEALVVSLIVAEIIFIICSIIMQRSFRNVKLVLTHDAIEKYSNSSIKRIFFKDIKKINVVENSSGEIVSIKIRGDRQMHIYGLRNMKILLRKIVQSILNESIVVEKKEKVDWKNPFVLVLIIVLINALFVFVRGYGDNAFHILVTLIFLIDGIYILLYKPIPTSFGINFKSINLIAGISLLFLSVSIYVYFLVF